MAGTVTLEQVEELAARLPPDKRLQLAAHIHQQLNVSPTLAADTLSADQSSVEQQARQDQLRLAQELLAEVEDIEDDTQGTDTAETMRHIRSQRITQLCRNDV
ncbi:MAG: hypothetical protein M3347_12360 [Armatimonadota bacterium]|nr:hypothetical protein [Armatimonadota bacterium]